MAALGLLLAAGPAAAAERYVFGVLPQRSAVLTARYWNPILRWVSDRTGIALELEVARTGDESRAAAARGGYDFVYSNHVFEPSVAPAGYRPILRPRAQAITGRIVVLDGSPFRSLRELAGAKVGFPSRAAFVAYALPMDRLVRDGIEVEPVLGGNQEGILGQLKAGRVAAAAVNSELLAEYAAREGLRFRVLWESKPYLNMPVAVHPRVPPAAAQKVQAALAAMADDPEGRRVLEESARAVGQKAPVGFLPASAADYQGAIDFYRATAPKGVE
jgi:phosphonate transport system substrate-binding protein